MTKGRSPLTALLCLMPLSAAWAQPAALRWQAPTGCPTQADVEAMLSRVDHTAGLEIDASVQRAAAGYRLRLRVRGEGRMFERELRAQSCAVLAESSVWLVQLAATQLSAVATSADAAARNRVVDESAARDVAASHERVVEGSAARGAVTARERVVEDGAAPSREASERESADGEGSAARVAAAREPDGVAPADAREREREDGEVVAVREASVPSDAAAQDNRYLNAGAPDITHEQPGTAAASGEGVHFRLGFGAAVMDVGLSGLAPHLGLDLTLALADWSVGLRLGVLLHPELIVAGVATVDLQTNAVQLLGCRLWDVSGALIGPCLTLSGLQSLARTRGLTGGAASSAAWLAAGPALMLQLRVTRAVLVAAEIGAWAALSPRPSFEVSDSTLARAGTLAGYARLGASYELW